MKPTLPDVLPEFAAYYARHPAWGALHVVLSDGNHADVFVDGAIAYAVAEGDAEGERLARLLRAMSRTQRGRLPGLVRAMVAE